MLALYVLDRIQKNDSSMRLPDSAGLTAARPASLPKSEILPHLLEMHAGLAYAHANIPTFRNIAMSVATFKNFNQNP
ncbi:MAG: hypothetical protein ACRC7G_04625 [Beijerinckiaceae bacterium]